MQTVFMQSEKYVHFLYICTKIKPSTSFNQFTVQTSLVTRCFDKSCQLLADNRLSIKRSSGHVLVLRQPSVFGLDHSTESSLSSTRVLAETGDAGYPD